MNDVDLSSVFADLSKDETNVSVKNSFSFPKLILNCSRSLKHSNTQVLEEKDNIFTWQDEELLSMLVML